MKSKLNLTPFLLTALGWMALSAWVCWRFSPDQESALGSVKWMLVLAGICCADLFSLAKVVAIVLDLIVSAEAGITQNRTGLAFQASFWGGLKLACLLLFGAVLYRGQNIPTAGLLAGTGTVVVVPLIGGLFWHWLESRKEL